MQLDRFLTGAARFEASHARSQMIELGAADALACIRYYCNRDRVELPAML